MAGWGNWLATLASGCLWRGCSAHTGSGAGLLWRVIACSGLVLPVPAALGWSDHASLLWPVVRTYPAMLETTLEAEPLEAFLQAEADGIAALLVDLEADATGILPEGTERPDALAFDSQAADLRDAFLQAIRVNPTLVYALHYQTMVGDTPDNAPGAPSTFAELSFLSPGVTNAEVGYRVLAPGDRISPAHVLASGSDEPDFGMDIGLFADNGTDFGARYGFGDQPFGNPNLEYSSQAPFHMGFYHLDWLTRTAQPDLLRTFPEWRIYQYRALAKFAFDRGHDYWGWRFMGWALHYIGDLTQPYHAQPLPGVNTGQALWTLLKGETEAAIQRVSNRHGVLESYQYQRVMALQSAQAWQAPLLTVMSAAAAGPAYSETFVRGPLTADSVAAGTALDAALMQHVPDRFVSDPGFEWTGSGEETQIVDKVRAAGGDAALLALDASVAEQLSRFGAYAHAWIREAQALADVRGLAAAP